MMKNSSFGYQFPEVEVTYFSVKDVITTSGEEAYETEKAPLTSGAENMKSHL